jgi:hypothetical protein
MSEVNQMVPTNSLRRRTGRTIARELRLSGGDEGIRAAQRDVPGSF